MIYLSIYQPDLRILKHSSSTCSPHTQTFIFTFFNASVISVLNSRFHQKIGIGYSELSRDFFKASSPAVMAYPDSCSMDTAVMWLGSVLSQLLPQISRLRKRGVKLYSSICLHTLVLDYAQGCIYA